MNRVGALVVSALLVGAALWPVVRDPHDDGFPLSTYPMFATPRDTKLSISFAYGKTARGERRTLDSSVVGSSEVLQALTTIARTVGGGPLASASLCERIAGEVAGSSRFDDVLEVLVVTGDEDAVAYLGDGKPGREMVRARCAVRRPGL